MCQEPTEFLLDWFFDRINLDPKIQIRYTDTKHQIADILTNGNFIRDEWNNLLHLFNITIFSSLCCAENFCLISCTERMAKRMQQQSEGKQDSGEIQANGDETDQFCGYKFFICEQSDCFEKPWDTPSFKSAGWIIRETWCKHEAKFQSRRSVEFSRMAKGCSTLQNHRETCGD